MKSEFVTREMIDPEFWEYIKEIVAQQKERHAFFYHDYPLKYFCEFKDDTIL